MLILVRLMLIAVLMGFSSAALADSKSDEARGRFDNGNAAFALGNYPEAAKEYEAAFALKPDPALLYNAAQAHRLANSKERALLLYQNYLRVFGHKVQNRDEVQRHIATLKQAIDVETQSRTSPPTAPVPDEGTTSAPSEAPSPPPPAQPAPRPTLIYAGIGTAAGGVILIVVGGVLNALARSAAAEINDPAPGYVFQPSTVDSVHAKEAASIALLSVGGAAAAAGIVLIAIGAKRRGERPAATVFAPIGPAGSTGASLSVTF